MTSPNPKLDYIWQVEKDYDKLCTNNDLPLVNYNGKQVYCMSITDPEVGLKAIPENAIEINKTDFETYLPTEYNNTYTFYYGSSGDMYMKLTIDGKNAELIDIYDLINNKFVNNWYCPSTTDCPMQLFYVETTTQTTSTSSMTPTSTPDSTPIVGTIAETPGIIPTLITEVATTQAITQETTQAITQATTQAITQASTQAITRASTQASTQATTKATTAIQTSIINPFIIFFVIICIIGFFGWIINYFSKK